jgi:peptidoglycan-associated lipoprotein
MSSGSSVLAKNRRARVPAVIAAAVLLFGCSSKPVRESDEPSAPPSAGDVATVSLADRAPATDLGSEERTARDALEQQGMVILFDYDSSQVRPQYVDLIAAHARYAGRFTTVALRLEGHTDERGSREYNIGLGDRRAQAVRRAFELQGVPASRITTVSYGEERPAVVGSGEGSWSQNRRVEIRYQP